MKVPGPCFGRMFSLLYSAAPAFPCDYFVRFLNLDKAVCCLGTLQIRMIPALK